MDSRSKRVRRTPQKKKRKFFITLSVLTLLLVVSVGYAAFQDDNSQGDRTEDVAASDQETSDNNQPDQNPKPSEKTESEHEEDIVNILLVGIDSDKGKRSRTDTIMIAQYHPEDGTAKLASIMRDTYVSIPGYRDNKINASFFFGGPELLKETIAKNFGITIDYYAMVNYQGFIQAVDTIAPDGVEIDIPKRMYYHDQASDLMINFHPGLQTLDGQDVLNYVRFRSDSDNDFGRVRRQQEVLGLLKDEVLTLNGISKAPKLIGLLDPYVDTNIKGTKVLSLGSSLLVNKVEQIDMITIPVEDGYVNKHIAHAGAVLKVDLDKNKQALDQFFERKTEDEDEMTVSSKEEVKHAGL